MSELYYEATKPEAPSGALELTQTEMADETTEDDSHPAPKMRHRRVEFYLKDIALTIFEIGREPIPLPAGALLPPDVASGLSDVAIYALLYGIWHHVRRAEDPAKSFADLVDGKLPTLRRVREKELPPWRMAVAVALFKAARKRGTPLTQDEANAKAAAISTALLHSFKHDRAVVAEYESITGRKSTLGDLLLDQ